MRYQIGVNGTTIETWVYSTAAFEYEQLAVNCANCADQVTPVTRQRFSGAASSNERWCQKAMEWKPIYRMLRN